MAKKKQPDFQPTKLRVGKHLPKGRNVTNTSFKSKKIITKDQKMKTSVAKASLEDLILLSRHTNVAVKTDGLKRIVKYIEMHDSSLPTYFTEILKRTGKLFLDLHHKVRAEAVNVIKTSANILSELQMSSFKNVLLSHINCMMTHVNLSVKKDSLHLLSHLLQTHPSFICHSTTLLKNLLNMISSEKFRKGDSVNQKKRKLDDNINTTMTSVEWRDQVLKLIAEFLEKLIHTYSKKKEPCEDEQKVRYDGKRPLFIQLYAGGGLTPAKMETPSDLKRSKSKVTEELNSFFSDVVSVASDVVTEEIAGLKSSSDKHTLRPDNVEHLNTVTQVLCNIADWYNMDSQIEDENFIILMNSILRKKLMKGFCYKIHESALKKATRKIKEMSCARLNLGISYLYCSFILGTEFENAILNDRVLFMVLDIINETEFQDVKTVSLVLKIIRSFLKVFFDCFGGDDLKKSIEMFSEVFNHLCEMSCRSRDTVMTKEIQSFLIEISLDYDYKFLLDSNALDIWGSYAFDVMMSRKADKELLKCINLMCCREYPPFIDRLQSSNPSEIICLLKLDDEDYQSTVINLITHMTSLPVDFLETALKLILCDQNLSLDIISKLIRSLYARFVDQRVSQEEFKEFLRFLLNVSFDLIAVQKAVDKYSPEYFQGHKYSDEESSAVQKEEYSDGLIHLLFYVQQGGCIFTVVPSQQWERHSKILEVCLECLVIPQDRGIAMEAATDFFAELLNSKLTFPVHSAIALLKLATEVYLFEDYCIPQEKATIFTEDLICSSLFYISIVTHKEPPEKFKALCVSELQNALGLNNENAYTLSQMLINRLFEQAAMDEASLLHVLRIIKFLKTKNKIGSSALLIPEFHELFRTVEMYCSEESEQRAVLTQIYELFQVPHA